MPRKLLMLFLFIFLIFSVKPIFAAPYTVNDIFLSLDENHADIASGYAIFTIVNPTNRDITLNVTSFFAKIDKEIGTPTETLKLFVLTNVNYSIPSDMYGDPICTPIENPPNASYTQDCQPTIIHYLDNYTQEEWVPLTTFTFVSHTQYKIRIEGTWKPKIGLNAREWIPSILIGTDIYNQTNWAWWNTTFGSSRNITFTDGTALEKELLEFNATGLTLSSGQCWEVHAVDYEGNQIGIGVRNNTGQAAAAGSQHCRLFILANSTNPNITIYYNNLSATEPSLTNFSDIRYVRFDNLGNGMYELFNSSSDSSRWLGRRTVTLVQTTGYVNVTYAGGSGYGVNAAGYFSSDSWNLTSACLRAGMRTTEAVSGARPWSMFLIANQTTWEFGNYMQGTTGQRIADANSIPPMTYSTYNSTAPMVSSFYDYLMCFKNRTQILNLSVWETNTSTYRKNGIDTTAYTLVGSYGQNATMPGIGHDDAGTYRGALRWMMRWSENEFNFSQTVWTTTVSNEETSAAQPKWFNNTTNSTAAGAQTLFSLNWTDNTGLSGYIFQFDNCTGEWVNDTWTAFNRTIELKVPSTPDVNDNVTNGTWAENTLPDLTYGGHAYATLAESGYAAINVSGGTVVKTTGDATHDEGVMWNITLPVADNIAFVEFTAILNTSNGGRDSENIALWNFTAGTPAYTNVGNAAATGTLTTLSYNATGADLTAFHNGNRAYFLAYGSGGSSDAIFVDYMTYTIGYFNTSVPQWSNVTKGVNATGGCTIRWCFKANNTGGTFNNSACDSPFSFVTSGAVAISNVSSLENTTFALKDAQSRLSDLTQKKAEKIQEKDVISRIDNIVRGFTGSFNIMDTLGAITTRFTGLASLLKINSVTSNSYEFLRSPLDVFKIKDSSSMLFQLSRHVTDVLEISDSSERLLTYATNILDSIKLNDELFIRRAETVLRIVDILRLFGVTRETSLPTTCDMEIAGCGAMDQENKTYCLTQDIIESAINPCMNITANNTILNCQGHLIDGVYPSGNMNMLISLQINNFTLENCNITDWYPLSMKFNDSSNIGLKNFTVMRINKDYAGSIRIYGNSSNIDIANYTCIASGDECVGLYGNHSNMTITDVYSENNTQILYSRADVFNLSMTNLTGNNTGNGDIYLEGKESNITIVDFDSINSAAASISMYGTENNITLRNGFINNSTSGIDFNAQSSSNVILDNYTINNSEEYGIIFNTDVTINMQIINSTVENSQLSGIYVNTYNVTVINSTIKNNGLNYGENDNYGIELWQGSQNISNSIFTGNARSAIYLCMGNDVPTKAVFFNNLFNSSLIINSTPSCGNNYAEWNITNQTGVRIYSLGPWIGGNYYTNSTNNGYSDICTDLDQDGFCDSPINLTTMTSCTAGSDCEVNSTDYLPYSDEYLATQTYLQNITSYFNIESALTRLTGITRNLADILSINSISSRFSFINIFFADILKFFGVIRQSYTSPTCDIEITECTTFNQANKFYCLTNDIINFTGNDNCMITSADNITLDCLNHKITFNGTDYTSEGIEVNNVNVTIQNCEVDGFEEAIIASSENCTFENITSINSNVWGILDENSYYNTYKNIYIEFNIYKPNLAYGFVLRSDGVNITNITIKNATGLGVSAMYFNSGDNNTIDGLTIDTATDYGVIIDSNSNNNIINNSNISNTTTGVYANGNDNMILNSIFYNNGIGIDLEYSNITVIGNTIQNSSQYGIYDYSNESCSIYNNILNNTVNVGFGPGWIPYDFWNTTQQSGTRIYLSGTNIGGNYYTNSTGNGYSDICADGNNDGFCDLPLNITNMVSCTPEVDCFTNATDYLPLSNEWLLSNNLISELMKFFDVPTRTSSLTIKFVDNLSLNYATSRYLDLFRPILDLIKIIDAWLAGTSQYVLTIINPSTTSKLNAAPGEAITITFNYTNLTGGAMLNTSECPGDFCNMNVTNITVFNDTWAGACTVISS